MIKRILTVLAVGLATAAVANATPLAAGGSVSASTLNYGGTTEFSTGASPSDGSFSVNYTVTAYSDPSNTLCANCLDFVYVVANHNGSAPITSVDVSFFDSFLTSVGYASTPGGVVDPTTITRSADGNTIDFLFGNGGLLANSQSMALVVQTNATNFSLGGSTTIVDGTASVSGVGFAATPEPSSFLLLGTGLIGLAGAAKRKFGV